MPDRFFCPDPPANGKLALVGDEARHLAKARRIGPGAVVEVFNGKGASFRAEVQALGRDRVDLVVLGPAPPGRSAAIPLTLATAVPKGERLDWLIEKATELGVARLVPLLTARSVVDPRGSKLDRLRRIVVEAAKQCGRDLLMEIDRPTSWAGYLRDERAGVRLIAHPGGEPPASCIGPELAMGAALAIGPEGGFTEEEVAGARELGWRVATLGGTLLRIETAALAGSATLLALAGEGPR